MQTSTSIEELTRKKTKSTDDLVNDILKELQTVPSVSISELKDEEDKEQEYDVNTESVRFHKSNKNEKKNDSMNQFHIIINKIKIPLIIMTCCFLLNLPAFQRYIHVNGPEWLHYYPNIVNIFKSLLIAVVAFVSDYCIN